MPPTAPRLLVMFLIVGAMLAIVPAAGQATHAGAGCGFPVEDRDLTKESVRLEAPAERVVVLDAPAAQIMWEVSATDRVVGMPVAEYTTYLDGAENRTNVVNGQQVLVEQVIGLDPDLVIAPNYVANDTIRTLRRANLTVYKHEKARSFDSIYVKTARFGHYVGACGNASTTVNETRARITAVRSAVADRDRPRVLYSFFGYTAGRDTYIHDLIVAAGGRNVAAKRDVTGYKQLSKEVVIDADPEWIVAPSEAALPTEWPYTNTTAMRENQTLVVNENLVSQAGPRVVQPLETMAHAFHPTAFARRTVTESPMPGSAGAVNRPTNSSKEPGTRSPTAAAAGETNSPTATSPTTPVDGPGLGVLVAIASAGLAVLRRR